MKGWTICNFCDHNWVTFYLMNWPIFLHRMKNTLLFISGTNILVRLLTVNMKNCLTPKNPKMCDPILVTLLKMWPHYSQSSLKMWPHPAAHPHSPLLRGYPPPSESPFVFLSEEYKRGSSWITSSLWGCRSPNFWTDQCCSLSSNWLSKCEHLFIDKQMVITQRFCYKQLWWVLGLILWTNHESHSRTIESQLKKKQVLNWKCLGLYVTRQIKDFLM